MKRFIALFVCILIGTSCTVVKPYERVYLNDPEMQMQNPSGKNFEQYVHSIREGAIPSTGTKSSGGCGCN